MPDRSIQPNVQNREPDSTEELQASFGHQPALSFGKNRRPPDRRRVSVRWMIGSVLTGVTSVLLMGGALYVAVDGREQLAQPANIFDKLISQSGKALGVVKGDRPVTIIAHGPTKEKILQVPTVTKVGSGTVIRKRPFAYASAPLAIAAPGSISYPKFNALTVFRASGTDNKIASSDVIYSADIEGEVRVEHRPFPLGDSEQVIATRVPLVEAETSLQSSAKELASGDIKRAPIGYFDVTLQTTSPAVLASVPKNEIKITAENVSMAEQEVKSDEAGHNFAETVITVSGKQTIGKALASLELQPASLEKMLEGLAKQFKNENLEKGAKLRVAFEQNVDSSAPGGLRKICRRISIYNKNKHIKSIALNDEGKIVWAKEPAVIPAVIDLDDKETAPVIETVAASNLPKTYDGIYRAALSQNLSVDHARRIVRTVAFDVDFRNKIKLNDELEIFYSLEEGQEDATESSEILYIGLTLSGKKRTYYRFATGKKGKVDYYDADGKSAKKFLLRKPVPNGKFRSAFGMRRHPISRVRKMHNGVDFSAPRGTRILAAGAGVVEKAGWYAGYGRQTIIRHANGYKTSYSHQHRIAKGIRPGARVVQGQVIGQVGSTGYSTGPHLHYEMIVNGSKVNPMKIRLPKGKQLKGEELDAFKVERNRIEALLKKARGEDAKVAAIN